MNPKARAKRRAPRHAVTNADIAEWLAREAEGSKPPLDRALRRASRRGFLRPEGAYAILAERRSLTELQGVGPYIEKINQAGQNGC